MKIRARIMGTSENYGAVKEFEIINKIPQDAEIIKLDHEQRTGDDNELGYFTFYYSEENGYVCVQTTEKEEDIADDAISAINSLKENENKKDAIELLQGIMSIYSTFFKRMTQNGYDEDTSNQYWLYVKEKCDLKEN